MKTIYEMREKGLIICSRCESPIAGEIVRPEEWPNYIFCSWDCVENFVSSFEPISLPMEEGICANCGGTLKANITVRVCSTKCAGELVTKHPCSSNRVSGVDNSKSLCVNCGREFDGGVAVKVCSTKCVGELLTK
jgi:hypothetical protein